MHENISVDKLTEYSSTEECTENVGEVKSAGGKEHVCSCTTCIAMAGIALGISIGIGAEFVYSRWYIKKLLLVLSLVFVLKQKFSKFIK